MMDCSQTGVSIRVACPSWLAMASLAVLLAGCCSRPAGPAAEASSSVYFLDEGNPVPKITLPQLTSENRKIAAELARPVSALREGLPHVQRVAEHPIQAAVEQGDWFFYATSTVNDQETHRPVTFIAGYAIKKGGREIVGWSVW